MDAALSTFLERGYHASTLEAVAEEAGYTRGAVYASFPSKADLLIALLDRYVGQRTEEVLEIAGEVDSVAGFYRKLGERWTERVRQGPRFDLLLIEFWVSAARDPQLRVQVSERHERLLGAIARVHTDLSAAAGETLAVPALEVVRACSAMAHGMALERLVSEDVVPLELLAWMLEGIAQWSVRSPSLRGSSTERKP
jgi:AcrR family transcriptional regulator